MITNLPAFLHSGASLEYDINGAPTPHEVSVAVVAVLAELAAIDHAFDSSELASIVSCLASELDLAESRIGELLEVARVLSSSGTKTAELVHLIRDGFSLEQRISVMAISWRLIMADQQTSRAEASFASTLRQDLGLSLEQAVLARSLVERGEIGPLKQALAVDANADDDS